MISTCQRAALKHRPAPEKTLRISMGMQKRELERCLLLQVRERAPCSLCHTLSPEPDMLPHGASPWRWCHAHMCHACHVLCMHAGMSRALPCLCIHACTLCRACTYACMHTCPRHTMPMHMTCADMCGMRLDAGAGESVGALGAGATARDRPWCWLGVCSAAAAGSHSGAAPVALPQSTMLLSKRGSGGFVGAGAAARDRPWSWLSFCPAPAACRHFGAAAAAAPCRPACSVSGAILCRMDLVQHAACRRMLMLAMFQSLKFGGHPTLGVCSLLQKAC